MEFFWYYYLETKGKKHAFYFEFIPICSIFAPQKYEKMVETLLLSVLIIAIGMALLLVKLVFKKNGEFTSQHIHDSQAMKDRNIHCVIDQDREARQKGKAY